MSEPLTPNGVVVHLGNLARELEKATDELGEAEREAIHAKETYRKARDTAFLKAEGPQYLREVLANEAAAVERVASELAAQKASHCKDRCYLIRTRIDIGRSVGSLLRAEMNL